MFFKRLTLDLPAGIPFDRVHGQSQHGCDIGQVGRHDQRVAFLRDVAELGDVLFGNAQLHRQRSAGRFNRAGNLPDAFGRGA